jgi:hypothetical protein
MQYTARLSKEMATLKTFDVNKKMPDPVSDPDPPTPHPDPIVQKVPAPNLSGSTGKVTVGKKLVPILSVHCTYMQIFAHDKTL